MVKPNALHHIAISTADMKTQIEFFSDVLGMELVALYWMHGVENAWHGFMKLGEASIAFVFLPENKKQDFVLGQTHAGHGGGSSAPGTMQHLALNVDTMEDLIAIRSRIRSRGIPAFGPIHHGMCSSIYFAGPDNLTLEISTSSGVPHPLDDKGTWIDKDVVKLAGISPEELKKYMNPAPFKADVIEIAQPDFDVEKPHMNHPQSIYQRMLKTPDELITKSASITEPPNSLKV